MNDDRKGYGIKNLPQISKPRERAKEVGVNNLADYELLAIILGTGSIRNDVLELANNLLSEVGNLSALFDLTIPELKEFSGIGDTKAINLLAAAELGKRAYVNHERIIRFKNLNDIYQYANNYLSNQKQEMLLAIFLDVSAKIIGKKIVSMGSVDSTSFSAKEIVKWALKYSSSALVITHNHPSGDCMPSLEDIDCTNEIIFVCQNVGIKFVDHLIIGNNMYYSFAKQKCLKV